MIRVLLAVLLSFHGYARTTHTCISGAQESSQGRMLKYNACLTRDDSVAQDQLLYYFPGWREDEEAWFESSMGKDIRRFWVERSGRTLPVITFSMGSETNIARDDWPSLTLAQVLPEIERRFGVNPSKRLVLGKSLGGWNALQLVMADQDYFQRIGLICPAVMPVHPWSSEQEIDSYRERSGVRRVVLKFVLKRMRKHYERYSNFQPFDPYLHLKNRLDASAPSFFISANREDEFGFQVGGQDLKNMLVSSGIDVKWRLHEGSHCEVDAGAVAEFLRP